MTFANHNWSPDPLNLLSPEIVNRVSVAVDAGIICGIHAFYCAGRGPEPCAFGDLSSYLHGVEKSRPGDWFTLWSVPKLIEQGLSLVRKQKAAVTEDEFKKAKDWLDQDISREFLAMGYSGQGTAPEAKWGDYGGFDELEDLANRYSVTGEFAAFPLTSLLESENRRWVPKFHVVDAKRPNERGEVPLGGAY